MHRIDANLARCTARHDYTVAALGNRRRLINEVVPRMTFNFLLNSGEQFGLLHGDSERVRSARKWEGFNSSRRIRRVESDRSVIGPAWEWLSYQAVDAERLTGG